MPAVRGTRRRPPLTGRHLRLALASALLALVTALAGVVSTAGATSTYDMRGEWSYTLTCSCGKEASGILLFTQENFANGEFSGTEVLDGFLDGTASGTVSGSSLSLKTVIPSAPPNGEEFTFTVASGTLTPATNQFSGNGVYGANTDNATGEIKAKLVRTLQQIEEKEKEEELERIQKAKEAKEKQEAKEKLEAEEKVKTEEAQKAKEAKEAEEKPIREKEKAEAEQHEREAKEKQAKEAQEAKEKQTAKEQQEAKARQEAKEREALAAQAPAPAKPSAKTLAVSSSGLASLSLSNPNDYAISGEVTLTAAAGKSASRKHASTTLVKGSFSISADGTVIVKLKLSKSTATELARRKSLPVTVAITTGAGGRASITTTYSVTLRAAGHARH